MLRQRSFGGCRDTFASPELKNDGLFDPVEASVEAVSGMLT
jgi:hypothetical protein